LPKHLPLHPTAAEITEIFLYNGADSSPARRSNFKGGSRLQ
jgi:hypothetical protein